MAEQEKIERHPSVDLPLRFLGLGDPDVVPADERGRVRADALASALADDDGPVIVVLQAGNIHSGDFDPFAACVRAAREHGAWVHVDGAFGLWAAASPRWQESVVGLADADSWATDAHKTLNVPYDSGLAIVRDPAALVAGFGVEADYLIGASGDPMERVPEFSRRARGFAVWAALRSLGRDGLAVLVDRLCATAAMLAKGFEEVDEVEVVNDVVFTQVMFRLSSDERTAELGRRLLADGTCVVTPAAWAGRAVQRCAVSNWSTSEADADASVQAILRAAAEVDRA